MPNPRGGGSYNMMPAEDRANLGVDIFSTLDLRHMFRSAWVRSGDASSLEVIFEHLFPTEIRPEDGKSQAYHGAPSVNVCILHMTRLTKSQLVRALEGHHSWAPCRGRQGAEVPTLEHCAHVSMAPCSRWTAVVVLEYQGRKEVWRCLCWTRSGRSSSGYYNFRRAGSNSLYGRRTRGVEVS
jgi:hypothetical protein